MQAKLFPTLEDQILEALENTALNSMEICRLINGIQDFRKCYEYKDGAFAYKTKPQRCAWRENGCQVWSFKVYNTLRKLQRKGKVKSILLRWFDKRASGKGLKADVFRFWFIDKRGLANRLISDIHKYLL